MRRYIYLKEENEIKYRKGKVSYPAGNARDLVSYCNLLQDLCQIHNLDPYLDLHVPQESHIACADVPRVSSEALISQHIRET